jgi:hypothetical protein
MNLNDASRLRASHYSLYHPLGRLALSLPELDPRAFGITSVGAAFGAADEPIPIVTAAVTVTAPARSTARARRPAARARPSTDARVAAPKASPRLHEFAPAAGASAVLTPEPTPKDDKSPRKRRTGGGGATSAAAKRKRRDADEDGTATGTLPATKRTRGGPRGSAQADAEPASPVEETPAGDEEEKAGSGGSGGSSGKEKKPAARRARSGRKAPARSRRKDSPTTASEGAGEEAEAVEEVELDTADAKPEADANEKTLEEKEPVVTQDVIEALVVDRSLEGMKTELPIEENAPAVSFAGVKDQLIDANTDTPMDVDVPPATAVETHSSIVPVALTVAATEPLKDEKEDGELSEEGDVPPPQ